MEQKQIAVIDGDIVTLGSGDLDGVPIPANLAHMPSDRLRYVNGAIVDAAKFTRFYIDPLGRKHAVASDPSWQQLDCAWDAPLQLNGNGWRAQSAAELLAPLIKDECARRISVVLRDDATQLNFTAAAIAAVHRVAKGKGQGNPDDNAVLDKHEAARAWVQNMRARSKELIAAADPHYKLDSKWPTVPGAIKDIAADF